MSLSLERDLREILELTEALWADLRGARLFITGGTGFIGCWLLESLCHANRQLHLGAKAIVLTRDPEAFRRKAPHLAEDPALELLRGDVLDPPLVAGACSHLIHAAAEASTRLHRAEPLKTFDTLVLGTRKVLERASSMSVDRALFVSSGAVYGRQPPALRRIPDDWPGAPDCTRAEAAYAEGKRAAESLCAMFAEQSGLAVSMARCFAFTGPYLPLDGSFAIGNFIRDALAGGPIVVAGDGTPFRSYLYASDLTVWLWHLLLRGEPGVSVNVGSEEDLTITELAERVSRILGGIQVQVRGLPDPARPPERYVPETGRARALGLRMKVDLEDAILRTAQWNRGS